MNLALADQEKNTNTVTQEYLSISDVGTWLLIGDKIVCKKQFQ